MEGLDRMSNFEETTGFHPTEINIDDDEFKKQQATNFSG